jgi:hypothetical protein
VGSQNTPEEERTVALEYLQEIYNDAGQSTSVLMRAAIKCLPFENPKLSATAVTTMDGKSFTEALGAGDREKQKPLPPAAPALEHEAEELKGSMPSLLPRF